MVDIRYGITRIVSDSGSKGHDLDFDSIGVPSAMQAIAPDITQSPDFSPGNGIGALGNTTWAHKRTRQLTHSVNGSLTRAWAIGR